MNEGTARALSARDILHVWEVASAQPAWARPLTVLAVAAPGASWRDLAALPLGARDRLLLDVHDRTFGPTLRGLVRCLACDTQVELSVSARDLRAAPSADPAPFALDVEGVTLRARPVDTNDLAAASTAGTLAEARARILERCVLGPTPDGTPPGALPEVLVDALQAALRERDPLSEVLLDVACPSCARRWDAPLDIATITWSAVESYARRLFGEVHALARAYGWTEDTVLALGALRRRRYLDMVGA